MDKLVEKFKTFMWKHEATISWGAVIAMLLGMVYMIISKEFLL